MLALTDLDNLNVMLVTASETTMHVVLIVSP